MSYRILHVIAYIDNQDIPHGLMAAAARRGGTSKEILDGHVMDLEVQQAIIRLHEFSFLSFREREEGSRSYEMHKLVHEAVRYGLRVRRGMRIDVGKMMGRESELEISEAYYSRMALQIIDELFLVSEGKPWARCEQYMTHAIRVGEWAEGIGYQAFYIIRGDGGRRSLWMKGHGGSERLCLERSTLIRSGASNLATTYYTQGRYNEAEPLTVQALDLRREVLGEKHRDTIWSMAELAAT
ncbi:unnamed protein product [Clonostachys rosea f. rosea IK726]|uniref:MalT-like TPR region domain-containing protein n=2 Tax=Bionectria ochroleuca TaxID=29856 RepID=A0A0B7KLN7_BIOOC|nr:unnamed protein product [Clonostachys rosea f. rosea IK726]